MRSRIVLSLIFVIAIVLVYIVYNKGGSEYVHLFNPNEDGKVVWSKYERTFFNGREDEVVPDTPFVTCPAPHPIAKRSRAELRQTATAEANPEADAARLVSEKNQVMDELLARPDIPSDYGAEMVALFRDRTQDVYTRDFAVQHIGLYAETLNRRGTYDPASREAGELRRALWDASGETGTIVATAAFRALADLAGFDPKINARRLDSRLVSCAGDASASSAARVMAVQLCGERGIAASRPLLTRLLSDAATPVPLKKAAEWSLRALDGKVVAQ